MKGCLWGVARPALCMHVFCHEQVRAIAAWEVRKRYQPSHGGSKAIMEDHQRSAELGLCKHWHWHCIGKRLLTHHEWTWHSLRLTLHRAITAGRTSLTFSPPSPSSEKHACKMRCHSHNRCCSLTPPFQPMLPFREL